MTQNKLNPDKLTVAIYELLDIIHVNQKNRKSIFTISEYFMPVELLKFKHIYTVVSHLAFLYHLILTYLVEIKFPLLSSIVA